MLFFSGCDDKPDTVTPGVSIMKNLLVCLALSLISISAGAAGLLAPAAESDAENQAPPAVTLEPVVEGESCPGVGATGFTDKGLLLSCQYGVWLATGGSRMGGTFMTKSNGVTTTCFVENIHRGIGLGCACPMGYNGYITWQENNAYLYRVYQCWQ